MSQNSQNRFAALSPSSAANQPKRNSKKNKRRQSNEDGDEPLLEDRKFPRFPAFLNLLHSCRTIRNSRPSHR
jgi:hypothetical protein